MKLRDRIMLVCLGLLVLLLLLAAASLSLVSTHDRTIAGAKLEEGPIISYATQIQVQLPKITAEARAIPGSAPERADFERKIAATGSTVADLCGVLESTRATESANTLKGHWAELEEAIRSGQGIEDATAREELFSRSILPAGDGIRTTLSGIVERALSDMERDTLSSRDRVRNVQRVLLSIALLGIVLCVCFLAILGSLIRRPSQELVRMIDSVTTSSRLETPTATREEVTAVVTAIDRLLAHVRDTRRSDLLMLIQAERRAEHAMDCIPDALALANKSGDILYSNKTMVALLGKRPERISDLPWVPLLNIIDVSMTSATPQIHENFDRAIQLFLDGSEKFYLPGAHPLVSEEGGRGGDRHPDE